MLSSIKGCDEQYKPSVLQIGSTSAVLPFCLVCLVIFFLVIDARWIWLFRHAQLLDVDEAGVFQIAFGDYYNLQAGGLLGWLHAVREPSMAAPLTTALASLIFWFVGPHVVAGFVVPAVAGAVTIVATYFLARHIMSMTASLTASVLVASCPIIVNWSRNFHFSIPATAILTLALLCLVRSERLSRFSWTSLFGICLGLLPLARTMTIAYVPGPLLGALIQSFSDKSHRGRRLGFLGWAVLLAVATASSWMLGSMTVVFDYLVGFGYGSQAASMGPSLALWDVDAWVFTARNLTRDIYVPYALLFLAGFMTMPFLAARFYRQHGGAALIQAAMSSPVFLLLVCVIEALAALTSSPNKGSAFAAPIIPAMIILALWSLVNLSPAKSYQRLLGALCFGTCVISVVPLFDASWPIAKPFQVWLPLLGNSVVSNGRQVFLLESWSGGVGRLESQNWMDLNAKTASTLQRVNFSRTPIAFGFTHYIYNVNSVGLQMLLTAVSPPSLIQVDPRNGGDAVDSYRTWLATGQAASACLLLTWQGRGKEILPVTNDFMEEAARQTGFVPIRQWLTPDARTVSLWQRYGPQEHCPNKIQIVHTSSFKQISNSEHCDGAIDMVNERSGQSGLLATSDLLYVSGWLAMSTKQGVIPEAAYITLTDDKQTSTFFTTARIQRPDVAKALRQPALANSGYASTADVSMLNGNFTLGLAYKIADQIKICREFKLPIAITSTVNAENSEGTGHAGGATQ